MEFRWVALITLWTLIVGPIFDQPRAPRPSATARMAPAPAALR